MYLLFLAIRSFFANRSQAGHRGSRNKQPEAGSDVTHVRSSTTLDFAPLMVERIITGIAQYKSCEPVLGVSMPADTDPWYLRFYFCGDAPDMEIKLTRWSSETGVQQAVSAKLGVTGALLSLTDPSDQGAVVLLGDLLASVKEDGEPCAGEIDTQHRKVVTVQCKAAGGTSSAAGHTQPQGAAAVVAAPKQAVKGDRIQKPEASTRGQNQDKQLSTPDTESMHVVAGLLLQRSRTAPYAFLPIDSQPVWAWTLAVAVVEGLSRRASKAKGVGEKAPKK